MDIVNMSMNSELIRELRNKANWSQEDLAAASGLSLRTIQRVETDGTGALETRKALAAAFDLKPDDLILKSRPYSPKEMQVGTGLLLIWVGIAWFLQLGIAAVLIGMGTIYLLAQLVRVTVFRLPVLWELAATGITCLLAGLTAPVLGLEISLGAVGAVLLAGIGCHLLFARKNG